MNYPLLSEYVEAIKSAEDNFNQLKNLRPVLDEAGNPIMTSGNFAVVFKMEDPATGKRYAVKCFIKDQEGRSEAYRLISEELKDVKSDYLTSFRYLPDELFVESYCNEQNKLYDNYWPLLEFAKKHVKMSVDDRRNPTQCQFTDNYGDVTIVMLSREMSVQEIVERKHTLCVARSRIGGFYELCDSDDVAMDGKVFPVLVMDWVEGITLDEFIRDNLDDQYILGILAYRFSLLAEWLLSQPFAHGDLKPENIIVRDGCWLTLVDYDGMYVQAMAGQKAREIGSPDFRHPSRDEDNFNVHIDDFPLVSMLVSLKAIANDPHLLKDSISSDHLLFSANDYIDINNSSFLRAYYPSPDDDFNRLVALFHLSLAQRTLYGINPKLLELKEPDRDFSYDWCYEDSYGAEYSYDGLGLLHGPIAHATYRCRDRIQYIDDRAFKDSPIRTITLPESLTEIGKEAFKGCTELISIEIPDSVTSIGDWAFMDCTKLTSIVIPESVTSIGFGAFRNCTGLTSVVIPKSVSRIQVNPFAGCLHLASIIVSKDNKYFDSRDDCNAIIRSDDNTIISGCFTTDIPESVSCIGHEAFYGISKLSSIIIPNSVTMIDYSAFGKTGLLSVIIPNSVIRISGLAFANTCISSIVIPDSVASIGVNPFCGCKELVSIIVSSDNQHYDSRDNCNAIIETNTNKLKVGCCKTNIPATVTVIGFSAFGRCTELTNIRIPEYVTKLCGFSFGGCTKLASLSIPKSITAISASAFEGAPLSSISVDEDNSEYDSRDHCNAIIETRTDKLVLGSHTTIIPNTVKAIDEYAFRHCEKLTSISIPNSVLLIGFYAFEGCINLVSVELPASLISIQRGAFKRCQSLQSITIPSSVNDIGDEAFIGCTGLLRFYYPKGRQDLIKDLKRDLPNTKFIDYDPSKIL